MPRGREGRGWGWGRERGGRGEAAGGEGKGREGGEVAYTHATLGKVHVKVKGREPGERQTGRERKKRDELILVYKRRYHPILI